MKTSKAAEDGKTTVPTDKVDSPTPQQVYRAAKAYIENGLSIIPIRADGTKMPGIELLPSVWDDDAGKYRRPWGDYRQEPPTLDEIRSWFRDSGGSYGMAILGGKVSGNLEIIDLDNWAVVEPWMTLVRKRAPHLLDKLIQVKTPRPGLHVYYRCSIIGGNQKLARVPEKDAETGKIKPKTSIETKGEGGYCLAPPSPAACHKTGRCYTLISKRDLTKIPTITPEEREILLDCARALNCWQAPRRQGYARRPAANGRFLRPGDDFNARADWADILEPHGWTWNGPGGDGSDYWCRPGKSCATSASANFCGSDLFFVFSSNADPFEEGTAYSKFHAYTQLEHDGDFNAAAQALRVLGYGAESQRRSARISEPFSRYAEYPTRSRK